MIPADACRCGNGLGIDPVQDGNDRIIAWQCRQCLKLYRVACNVCRGFFRHLQAHLALSDCGPHDKAGTHWRADRRPGAPYAEAARG